MRLSSLCEVGPTETVPTNNMPAPNGGSGGGGVSVTDAELAFFVTDGSATGETVWSYAVARTLTLPAGLAGSAIEFETVADVFGTFSIRYNDETVGQINLEGTTASFTFPAPVAMSAGDELSLVSTGDYVFTSLAVTLRATL